MITFSFSTNSLFTNNQSQSSNSDTRMYQSYQNESEPQYAHSTSNRVRKLTAYDSVSSSPSPLTVPLNSNGDIHSSMSSYSNSNVMPQHPLSSMSSHSLNTCVTSLPSQFNPRQNAYRPQSSSSSSSSNHQNAPLMQQYHHQPQPHHQFVHYDLNYFN